MIGWGADADELERLAAMIANGADLLDGRRSTLSSHVNHAPWKGPEADRFRHDWNATHARSLVHATAFLRDAAIQLATNARQQREASSPGMTSSTAANASAGSAMPASVAAVLTMLLGPGWRSVLPANPTPSEVSALLHRVAQAEHWLKDPAIGLQGQTSWGSSGGVGTHGQGTIGGAAWQAYAKASYQAGAEGHASVKLTPDQLSVLVGGSLGLMATATAGGSLALGPLGARGAVDVTAQARAYADASAALSKDGIKASAEVGAIAGVSASAQGDVQVAGVGGGGSATAYAGAGVVAKGTVEVTFQHVDASVKLGAALGLGAAVEVHISVEPVKVANELSGEASKLTGLLSHGL